MKKHKSYGPIYLPAGSVKPLLALILPLIGLTTGPFKAVPMVATWYVDTAGDDSNDCQSPASACQTVGEAVARGASGDTVQIAAGVYQESLEITRPLTLIGAGADSTFLDGGEAQRVVSASNNPITLYGLTVRNGSVTNANGGGGLIILDGDVDLDSVTFSGKHLASNGGAISNQIGTLKMTNSTISGNSAKQYGGLANETADAQTNILNSTIANNTVTGSGTQYGGVSNEGTISFQNSIVADNTVVNCRVSGSGSQPVTTCPPTTSVPLATAAICPARQRDSLLWSPTAEAPQRCTACCPAAQLSTVATMAPARRGINAA